MATGRPTGAGDNNLAPIGAAEAPRRPSLALQPFAWGGLQILPVAASAVAELAVIPPPWPGMHRTAPFRISEYDQRCRLAVAALETAVTQASAQVDSDMADPALQAELASALDLSDLAVPLPPGIPSAAAAAAAVPVAAAAAAAPPAANADVGAVATQAPAGASSRQQRSQPPAAAPGAGAEAAAVASAVPTAVPDAAAGASASQQQQLRTGAVVSGKAEGDGSDGGREAATGAGLPRAPLAAEVVPGRSEIAGEAGGRPDVALAGAHGGAKQHAVESGEEGGAGGSSSSGAREGAAAPTEVQRGAAGPAAGEAGAHALQGTEGHQQEGQPLGVVAEAEEEEEGPPAKRRRGRSAGQRSGCSPDAGAAQKQKEARQRSTGGRRRGGGAAAAAAGLPATAAAGVSKAAGGAADGGGLDQQRERQQQQQGSQAERGRELAAWWGEVTAAAAKLESLQAVLQAPPPGRAGAAKAGPEAGAAAAQRTRAGRGCGPGASPSPKAGEDEDGAQEQGEAAEEGEGGRRRRKPRGWQDEREGEGEDEGVRGAAGLQGGVRTRRRKGERSESGAAAAAAAAAGYGAYGNAADFDVDSGGEQEEEEEEAGAEGAERGGRPSDLAAAAAAVERIRLAVAGPELSQAPQRREGVQQQQQGHRSEDGGEEPEPSLRDELVVWVAVGAPGQPHKLHEELLLLGSQTLAELRDVLGCATEDAMREAAAAAAAAGPAVAAPGGEGGRGEEQQRGGGGGGRRGGGRGGQRAGRGGGGRRGGAKAAVADAAAASQAEAAAALPPSDGSPGAAAAAGGSEAAAGGSAGLLPPSHGSYLFMEGRFYRDVRHPEAEDYSEPIRALCRAHGVWPTMLRPDRSWRPGLGRDTGQSAREPAAMHETRVQELTVRQANHPTALFCHRACCEHLLFVRDVRRWHPGDPTRRAAYPLRLRCREQAAAAAAPAAARRRCGLCEARQAELVTHDDPLAPSNPAIMCRQCFDLLHIGSSGERLVPDLVVQPYNPALDIPSQDRWAPPAGPWAVTFADRQ